MLIAATAIVLIFLITPPLLLRLRPRSVAAFNLKVTNRIAAPFATWFPGFGVITHIGRKSGRTFRTPVNVFRSPAGFLIALTYGPDSHWVQNVLAAGSAELETRRAKYHLTAPTVVHDPTRQRFPLTVALRILGTADFLQVSNFR